MSRKSTRLRNALIAAIVAVFALIVLLIVVPWQQEKSAAQILKPVPQTSLTRALLALPAAEGPYPAYSRDQFGPSWADVDGNGCDTRNDILARDLQQVAFKPGTLDCVVASGIFTEPYTDALVTFERGAETSAQVQIDHVVALADAWRSGAWEWSAAQRLEFANDPLNLLAVDGAANQNKSSSAADDWLPPNRGYWCAYTSRQIAVKDRWGLGVTEAERSSLARVIATCEPQEIPGE